MCMLICYCTEHYPLFGFYNIQLFVLAFKFPKYDTHVNLNMSILAIDMFPS